MPITTNVVTLNPAHGGVYSIQCDKVCQSLATGRRFSQGTLVSSTNKTDSHDITEILLKVALNTITITISGIIKYAQSQKIENQKLLSCRFFSFVMIPYSSCFFGVFSTFSVFLNLPSQHV